MSTQKSVTIFESDSGQVLDDLVQSPVQTEVNFLIEVIESAKTYDLFDINVGIQTHNLTSIELDFDNGSTFSIVELSNYLEYLMFELI